MLSNAILWLSEQSFDAFTQLSKIRPRKLIHLRNLFRQLLQRGRRREVFRFAKFLDLLVNWLELFCKLDKFISNSLAFQFQLAGLEVPLKRGNHNSKRRRSRLLLLTILRANLDLNYITFL